MGEKEIREEKNATLSAFALNQWKLKNNTQRLCNYMEIYEKRKCFLTELYIYFAPSPAAKLKFNSCF